MKHSDEISQCIIFSCFIGDHLLPSQLFSIHLHQILAELYSALRRFLFSDVRPTNGGIRGRGWEHWNWWKTYKEIVCRNLTLIFYLILCLVELNSAFIGLDWDECMHIRIVEDLVPPSTLASSLSVHWI